MRLRWGSQGSGEASSLLVRPPPYVSPSPGHEADLCAPPPPTASLAGPISVVAPLARPIRLLTRQLLEPSTRAVLVPSSSTPCSVDLRTSPRLSLITSYPVLPITDRRTRSLVRRRLATKSDDAKPSACRNGVPPYTPCRKFFLAECLRRAEFRRYAKLLPIAHALARHG